MYIRYARYKTTQIEKSWGAHWPAFRSIESTLSIFIPFQQLTSLHFNQLTKESEELLVKSRDLVDKIVKEKKGETRDNNSD